MASFVVDASVVVPMLMDGPLSQAVKGTTSDLVRGEGGEPHAPDLLLYEVANVLGTAQRKGMFDRVGALERVEALGEMAIGLHPPDPRPALAHSIAHGLSAYDASYLALALKLGATLLTGDRRLADAALGAGSAASLIKPA